MQKNSKPVFAFEEKQLHQSHYRHKNTNNHKAIGVLRKRNLDKIHSKQTRNKSKGHEDDGDGGKSIHITVNLFV